MNEQARCPASFLALLRMTCRVHYSLGKGTNVNVKEGQKPLAAECEGTHGPPLG